MSEMQQLGPPLELQKKSGSLPPPGQMHSKSKLPPIRGGSLTLGVEGKSYGS